MSDEHVQETVAKIPVLIESSDDGSSEFTNVFCPNCFRPTDSLKVYNIGKVIFFIGGVVWNYETVIACPACMRRAIAKRTLISIVLTNLLFPIAAIFYFGQFIATFFGGHSDLQIAGENRRRTEDRFLGAEHSLKRWSWPDLGPIWRFIFLVLIAVLALPAVLFILGLYMWLFGKN